MSAIHMSTSQALFRTVLVALAALSFSAQAASVSFQGDFTKDNDLVIFSFELAAPGDITALTFGHSGGLNGAGQTVPAGGFAPVLTLFDATGFEVQVNVGSSNTCPGPGSFCWDAAFTFQGAAAGSYLLVLSQDDNRAIGGPVTAAQMASFFSREAEPHYTAAYLGMPTDGSVNFVRIDGSQRTGHWAVDINVSAPVTVVPEPASALLFAAGLAGVAGLALARRRRG